MSDEQESVPAKESDYRWMLKIGIGGVMVAAVLPWMMLTISQGVKSQTNNAVAMEKAANSMDDLADVVKDSVEESQNLRTDLAPLVRELDRVADAVRAQTKQQAQTAEAADP